MRPEFKQAKDIFLAAVEMPNPEERAEFLREACAGDDALRHQVDGLLRRHEDAGSFLERPPRDDGETGAFAADSSTPAPPAAFQTETIGMKIGPYKLVQQLGEGGMGTVWVAEQTEPVKRRVALKVIKPGLDSAQVVRRFEAERQALALMDHTNIAKVLDAGSTPAGRPYFVMELVKGVPITKYCDELHLPLRERLELLVPVCQAIQHAHQKGIIHRDIKPSNVLVAIEDGKPVPKVIDFGVAKALHHRLANASMYTEIGQIIGTLEYMSPEQAELSALDIDTRADVYALGVLMYELLTGTTPLDKSRIRSAAFTEMLRIIKEVEPPRPSTRLTDSKDSLPSLAAQRRTVPQKLARDVRGELDWIVMRCLEKDRTRRYESASGLAKDIEHHLRDEPVEACPPGALYRLGKALRRNKGRVLAASLLLLALIAGMANATWGFLRVERERRRALAALDDAHLARAREIEQRRMAQDQRRLAEDRRRLAEANEKSAIAERQKSEAVQSFLQRDLLSQADATQQANTTQARGGGFETTANPTIKDLLNRAATELTPAKVESKFPAQPAVQASILKTVGDTYRGIGEFGKAIEFLIRASDMCRNLQGAEHADTLAAQSGLALAYLGAGKAPQALELLEHVAGLRIKKLGADHPETLNTLNALALAYLDMGKMPEAIKRFEQVRVAQVKSLGAEHPDTLNTMHHLAGANLYSGNAQKAIELYEPVLTARLKLLSADHPETISTMNNLAVAYQDAGNLTRSIALLEQVRSARLKQNGPDHPETLSTLNFLASVYKAAGKLEMALPIVDQIFHGLEKRQFEHQYASSIMANIIDFYEQAHQDAKAQSLRQTWLCIHEGPIRGGFVGIRHPAGIAGPESFAKEEMARGRIVTARCLSIREKTQHSDWTTSSTKAMLGEALAGQKNFEAALPLLLAGYKEMKTHANPASPRVECPA